MIHLSKSRYQALDRMSMMGYLVSMKKAMEGKGITIPKSQIKGKKWGAKGSAVYTAGPSIRVPKFTMMCAISAAGEKIPPWFLIPSSSANRCQNDLPVIGPRGYMDDSHAVYTKKGSMTGEKFQEWLKEIFLPLARRKLADNDWIMLALDNCACHISTATIRWAHRHLVILGYFHPNSTHAGSPLDVGIFGPFKQKLAQSLGGRKDLAYRSITSWVGPAWDSVSTKQNILSAFSATGLWRETTQGPDINWISSQFGKLMSPLPDQVKKANSQKREVLALKHLNDRLDKLHQDQVRAIEEGKKAITGPAYIAKSVAGSAATEQTIAVMLEKQQELVKLQERQLQIRSDVKAQQQNEIKKKVEKKTLALKTTLASVRKENSTSKKQIRNLQKRLDSQNERIQKLESQLNIAQTLSQSLFDVCQESDLAAESILAKLDQRKVDHSNLKRNRSRNKQPTAKRRK
jgi:hypothetical protein